MPQARESMQTDVLIIGAGPAGLATAIKLAQLAKTNNSPLSIMVLEKAAAIGAHILAGAVLEPRSLNELIPDWQAKNAPLNTKAVHDELLLLTANNSFRLPTPPSMRNTGNYIISLGQLCRWLATQAESLGVQIFPGFAATQVLYAANAQVIGVSTGDMGVDKTGNKKPNYQAGINILAKYTVCAEGSRGSITKEIINKFNLQQDSAPQTYALGIKELWEIPAAQHKAGTVIHTIGWPLDINTYGGSFIYYLAPNLLALGLAVGLDYRNPYLSPYDEFQRFKLHPKIKTMLQNGRCLEYGARVINEGGLQSLPKLYFPGGLLVGCAAGFVNVPKIKGIHTAIKSGMLAAECIIAELQKPEINNEIITYSAAIKNSWIWQELKQVRNIRPAFKYGLWFGLSYAALDTYILRGKAPWTFSNHCDNLQLQAAHKFKPLNYPKYDGTISFDKMSSLLRANIQQSHDQSCHLVLKDPLAAITINYAIYNSPEQRYCPAGVYEIINNAGAPYLQINAQNCIHCKACDVKDPTQNINWLPPEGGGGPNYNRM